MTDLNLSRRDVSLETMSGEERGIYFFFVFSFGKSGFRPPGTLIPIMIGRWSEIPAHNFPSKTVVLSTKPDTVDGEIN